jgi:predicted DNA binding CopG/RHH family protein
MNSDQSYENDILTSFEKGEWQPVKNQKKENARYRELAAATLRKSRRVNIRISAMDLEGLQAKAAEEGLPYQTLMASILHKYVSGRLVDGAEGITSHSSRTGRKRAAA